MLTDTSEPSVSRDKKCERLDELIGRKFFIEHFLRKSEEEIMGLDNDVLTKKQIMEEFLLQDEKEFISYMEKYHDLWENLYDCGDYDAGAGYGLIPKEKREQFFIETDREIKWLQETMGRNDAKTTEVTSPDNSSIRLLEDDLKIIHPIMDFSEGKAWTTIILPYAEKIDKGNGVFIEETKNGKFLINSAREKPILLKKSIMKKGIGNNIYLKVFPEFVESRWERLSFLAFQNGVNKHYTFQEIFNEVREHIKFYIELASEKQYDVVASWIIATYFFELFDAFGYLYLTGIKRVGKTKLLKILATLSFNGKLNLGITSASLFRSVHDSKLTLCLDEIDANTLKMDTTLNELLRGGYIKGHKVPRMDKKDGNSAIELKEHEIYSPKSLCNITGIDDVIEDRAITITMERAKNPLLNMRDVNMADRKWSETRNKLYTFMMEHWQDVLKSKEEVEKDKINFIEMLEIIQQKKESKTICEEQDKNTNGINVTKQNIVNEQSGVMTLFPSFQEKETFLEKENIENLEKETIFPKEVYNNVTNVTNNNNNKYIYNKDKNSIEEGLKSSEKKYSSVELDDKAFVVIDGTNVTSFGVEEDFENETSEMGMRHITQRNYQISLAILSISHAVSEETYKNVVNCLVTAFEKKKSVEIDESNDVKLVQVLVPLIDSKRWWKTSSIADAVKVSTEESWANSKWVGRSLNRIFPRLDRRKMSHGSEVLLSPEMVRGKAESIGLDVEQILAYSTYNPYETMNDIEKIKFKLKTETEMMDYKLTEWAVGQGITEGKAEQIVQKLRNEGYFMEIRAGVLKWALK